jgi:aspartate/methionine/tyrosine aminotransferase
VPAPDGDGWTLTKELASRIGVIVSPGEFYGPAAAGFVRIAAVQPDAQIELLAGRAAA